MDCSNKKYEFLQLNSIDDLATLLGFTKKQLEYWAYIAKQSQKYTVFTIPKRNGGDRIIKAPCSVLKSMQHTLYSFLDCIYNPQFTVHGYMCRKHRSIVSNAAIHAGSRYILNITAVPLTERKKA